MVERAIGLPNWALAYIKPMFCAGTRECAAPPLPASQRTRKHPLHRRRPPRGVRTGRASQGPRRFRRRSRRRLARRARTRFSRQAGDGPIPRRSHLPPLDRRRAPRGGALVQRQAACDVFRATALAAGERDGPIPRRSHFQPLDRHPAPRGTQSSLWNEVHKAQRTSPSARTGLPSPTACANSQRSPPPAARSRSRMNQRKAGRRSVDARGRRIPCGWRCGAELTASQMRTHFTRCSRRPKDRG